MIKVEKAKNESRSRDEKRQRILLTVGEKSWHLTQKEAAKLSVSLQRLLKGNAR